MKEAREFEIQAVSIATPATVNVITGTIISAPNVPALDGVRIVDELEKRLGIPAILGNDANAAAVGENWLGASRGLKNSIMVTLGTGVGGGLILNGEVFSGSDGTAGEIGHICVEPKGVKCGCGSNGCLEQYASALALVRMARDLLPELHGMYYNPSLNSADIYRFAKKGDAFAREAFRLQGYYLGIAIGGLINTLNPDVIVIGGGASAGWDLFIDEMIEQIGFRAYRTPAERAKLVIAELGDDAGLLGAAYLGFNAQN
ncbi:MAG: ROK family protein, partial [Acidobacteria bacterium]|nr:ROK family protein [Acidobacteriota bacterium]